MGTGKYKIGARVRDEDGDEGVIVGKRKGERQVKYDRMPFAGGFWFPKSFLTPIPDDDTPAPAGQEQGEAALVSEDGRIRFTATRFHIAGANNTPDWQPKVGDRVRFTDECREYWWFGPQKKYKDGTVSKTDGGGELPIHVKCSNGETAFVNADQIEPLPVAAEAQGAGSLEDDVTAIFDELEAWLGEDNPVAVAPATATPAAPARTFKVGDRVRVKCGDLTGTIASRNSAGAMAIRYDGGDYVGFQFWHDDELEPADTPVSADATATLSKGSLVTLAQPALVTGTDRHHAHLLLGTGGTYTLPVAALVAA